MYLTNPISPIVINTGASGYWRNEQMFVDGRMTDDVAIPFAAEKIMGQGMGFPADQVFGGNASRHLAAKVAQLRNSSGVGSLLIRQQWRDLDGMTGDPRPLRQAEAEALVDLMKKASDHGLFPLIHSGPGEAVPFTEGLATYLQTLSDLEVGGVILSAGYHVVSSEPHNAGTEFEDVDRTVERVIRTRSSRMENFLARKGWTPDFLRQRLNLGQMDRDLPMILKSLGLAVD